MKTSILVFAILLSLCLAIVVVSGYSATERNKAGPAAILKQPTGGATPTCGDINPQVEGIIQHDEIGYTWYDEQQIGSMGRVISVNNTGYRHFSWTFSGGEFPPSQRYVDANCKDPLGVYLGQIHADGELYRNAGYANQADLHDGISAIVHQRNGGTPIWYSTLTVDDDVCGGFFTKHWDLPDHIPGAVSEARWPKMGIVYDVAEDRDYIHIVETESSYFSFWHFKFPTFLAEPKAYGYLRCYISSTNSDTLYCQTFVNGSTATYGIRKNQTGPGSSAPIAAFDTGYTISPIVATSPVSQRVAVVYTKPLYLDGWEERNNVCYFESMTNGDDWIDGTAWPPYRMSITNYAHYSPEFAYMDVAACYDYNDSLHVVWNTTKFPTTLWEYWHSPQTNLYHWSKAGGISWIASAYWSGTKPGRYNRNMSKPSVVARDPSYYPGSDSVYLYTVWTQFDSSDNSGSAHWYTNGDLYACGSFNGGETWGRAFNLTNTKTSGCDPGECTSEHWPSGYACDTTLHIQYVCDRDPGAATQGEGEWLENPIMYLHLTQWSVPPEPRCAYRIVQPEHWYDPPLKVQPNGSETLILKVYSIGTTNLIYSASSGDPCIQGSGGGTLPPRDSGTVALTVSGEGECDSSFIDGCVELATNEGAAGTTYVLPVQAVVSGEYYECPTDPETYDTLDNGVLRLYLNANGEEQIHDIGTFWDEVHEVFFEGGTIVATTSGNDTLVGRYMLNDHHTGARESLCKDLCEVDWEPDFWVLFTKDIFIHDLNPPSNHNWFWWEFSKQIKFFTESAPEVYKHLVIEYLKVRRHDQPYWWPDQSPFTGYEDTYIGAAHDIDCPADTSGGSEPNVGNESACNAGGYDAVNEIAWQRGFGRAGEHPQYNNYYCGIALADAGQAGESIVPYGTYCVKNNHYVYPQSGWGWEDGQLYWLASQSGNSIEDADSLLDRSYVFTAQKIDAGDQTSFEASFTLVLAVAPQGMDQLQEYVDTGRVIVERECGYGFPIIGGDANEDGLVTAGDIVYLNSYLYRGGPPPSCPIKRADCNGDCQISAGDVVCLISYLFRNGPPPNCPCIWPPL